MVFSIIVLQEQRDGGREIHTEIKRERGRLHKWRLTKGCESSTPSPSSPRSRIGSINNHYHLIALLKMTKWEKHHILPTQTDLLVFLFVTVLSVGSCVQHLSGALVVHRDPHFCDQAEKILNVFSSLLSYSLICSLDVVNVEAPNERSHGLLEDNKKTKQHGVY